MSTQELEAAQKLHQAGQLDEAERIYRTVLQANPRQVFAWHLLGVVALQKQRYEEAEPSFREALRLMPVLTESHEGLGRALFGQGLLEDAIGHYRRALALRPDYVEAKHDLGIALMTRGAGAEAEICFNEVLRVRGDLAEAHFERACLWLQRGNLEQGWPEYEWRWRLPKIVPRNYPRPLWDGGAFLGKTILLHAEQGLGDLIQFIRYTPLVKERGGRVLFVCPKSLQALLAGFPGIDELLDPGSTFPLHDFHAPLLSLPGIFQTTLENIPAQVPYLQADDRRCELWRERLAHLSGFKVGIAWQGTPTFASDRYRSIPLARFASLGQVPGVCLVSLQKGAGSEQLAKLPDDMHVWELGQRFDEGSGAFMDTVAVMKNLDLVITSDTSIAHVAGALGVPVWTALSLAPDWRWLLARDDSPWYPTMRLFRQERQGDWDGVFSRMAAELERLVRSRSAGGIAAPTAAGELIDKLTILEIKEERLTDPGKLHNVQVELAALRAACAGAISPSTELARLTAELKTVNETLWQIEDDIRDCEREQDFGPRFIDLARSVYRQNDARAALKRAINELLGSELFEEKSYRAY